MVVKDGAGVVEHGFFHGYTPVVWAVIGIQAMGGRSGMGRHNCVVTHPTRR